MWWQLSVIASILATSFKHDISISIVICSLFEHCSSGYMWRFAFFKYVESTSINIVTFVGEWLLLSAKWTLFHCYFIARASYIRWDDDDSCFSLDWHTSFPLFESRFRDLIAAKFNFLLAAMFHPILSGHNYVPNCWLLIIYSR